MSIEEKRFKKLFKEMQFHKSEYELVLEILKSAHWDFEDYYRNYCSEKEIDLDKLNEKHKQKVEEIIPSPLKQKHGPDDVLELEKVDFIDNTSKKEFKKIYRELAKFLHPDAGGEEKEFKEFSDSFHRADWVTFLEICMKHEASIKNHKEINVILKKEISKIKDKIEQEKSTYSWLLYQCETEACKNNVVKKFLKHLFDYGDF